MTDEIVETKKVAQEVAKDTALEVNEKFGIFLAKVFGEPIKTVTGMLDDSLKTRRWERAVRLMDRVQEINNDRGIEGKEIYLCHQSLQFLLLKMLP